MVAKNGKLHQCKECGYFIVYFTQTFGKCPNCNKYKLMEKEENEQS